VDKAHDQFGIDLPLIDLAVSDPYKNATAKAGWGSIRANNHETQRPETRETRRPETRESRAPAPREERRPVVTEQRRVEPEPIIHPTERSEDYRRWDVEPERRHAFYWWGYHPGMALAALPALCVQVSVGPVGFYYYDGVFFQPTPAGSYTVVARPAGVVVPQLPDGAETVDVGGTIYYYAGGAFYVQQPNGFAVVPAPLGVTVTGLPPGAAPVTINGALYYVSG